MQSGNLTVTGNNSVRIPLLGRPREVFCHFRHEHEPVPCNPHHQDHLEYKIESVDEDLHIHIRIDHHHHDRQFVLVIKWNVVDVREIEWLIVY
jgi:hypothetical protein